METIEQKERKTAGPDYRSLLDKLPKRGFGYGRRVADLLNFNGIRPIKAERYNFNIVQQIVNKNFSDPAVEAGLILIVEERYGLPIEAILPEYVRFHPKRFLRLPEKGAIVNG